MHKWANVILKFETKIKNFMKNFSESIVRKIFIKKLEKSVIATYFTKK